MRTRFPLFVAGLLATTAFAQSVAPAAPDTRATPPAPPVLPARAPSLAELIRQFPGHWEGEQRVISPQKTVMLVQVSETYTLTESDGRPVLTGDIRYTIGTGATAKTFRGASKTWIDAAGLGHAEVTQDGKTENYRALAREDSLVFLPAGATGEPTGGTGVRVVTENGAPVMLVRGFQKSPQGTFIIEGRLRRVPAPR